MPEVNQKENSPPNFWIFSNGYSREFPNPGNFSNFHKRARNIMPQLFDGLHLSVRKSLAPNKHLLSNWILSQTYPSGFRIGGSYTWQCENNIMRTPKIEADVNPSTLSSNFSLLYYPFEWLKCDVKLQRLEKLKIAEKYFTMEALMKNSTYTIGAYNGAKDSGSLTLSYLQSFSMNLSAGIELFLEYYKRDLKSQAAFAVRYEKNRYALAATVSSEALDVTYWRQIHNNIQVGSSLEFNKRFEKAVGSISYQWEFKDGFVRGMLDSNFTAGFMYQRKVDHIPCNFGLSVLYSMPTNRASIGCSIDIDPALKCV